MIKEKLVMGREYLLYDGNGDQISFKAFYFGKKPVKIEWFMEPESPEGHLFARINGKEGLKIYCSNTSDEKLRRWFHSDGDNGLQWDAGFHVSEDETNKISGLEKEYLVGAIKKWSEMENASY